MKFNLLIFITITTYVSSFSQTFSGVVVDEYKNSIQAVSILNKNTNQHIHTNEEGKFAFENLSIGDSLQFYHVGYKTHQLVVDKMDQSLDVMLYTNTINLNEIVISPKFDALKLIADIDIKSNPVNSSQDILRKVPGLFIGQHAGGGKAEQIFLRGFDIDHGTDINITVDDLPVNMVSHAHGQGYADLHFLIPETINNVDFGKGPYYASKGNFNTAGYVNFKTKNKLDHNSIKVEAGQFETYRLLGMINLLDGVNNTAYAATEFTASNGPFESPQNFKRINLFGKYSGFINKNEKIGFMVSHFSSRWDASGQIPQRAVDSEMITRFGAIDDTEGGVTSRSNLSINHNKYYEDNSTISSTIFISQYDFELYSNFTFFLNDSINGDQIRQKEDRIIYGIKSEYKKSISSNNISGHWITGLSLRNDRSNDNELSHTLNRSETLERINFGNINETNLGAYVGSSLSINKWTFNPSIRLDYFDFQYNDALPTVFNTQNISKSILSPKLNILYDVTQNLQFYFKSGRGFHSNDTRVVVEEQGNNILPSAYGVDAGFVLKPISTMLLNISAWHLFLEQEFVYVGDAGIVEPSGQTVRRGLDLSFRYQPYSWLIWNLDTNVTIARTKDELEGQNFIPLAPNFTIVSGLNFVNDTGFHGSLNVRHIADRPANEQNSIVAEGYTVTDLSLGYKVRNLSFGFQIQNLFDIEWNETQFATESRLNNEIEPVEEIHFTPGTPFYFKANIEVSF